MPPSRMSSLAVKNSQPNSMEAVCPKIMVDEEACGRPIYNAPSGIDAEPVCLMHSLDPTKDKRAFREEIDAILRGESKCHRGKPKWLDASDRFEFTGFVFPEARFNNASFNHNADFTLAVFLTKADFHGAKFNQEVYFRSATFRGTAAFSGAEFAGDAYFEVTRFNRVVWFHRTRFMRRAHFDRTAFCTLANGDERVQQMVADACPSILEFKDVRTDHPELVVFYKVNKDGREGLRARFVNCEKLDLFRFEDVNWYSKAGRVVLQDELDITDPPKAQAATEEEQMTTWAESHELVAIAYRRLVSNAERARNYDLAEDCYVGAMEMKRLDPRASLSSRAIVTLYKWLSVYGSSYTRALGMLGGFLLAFVLLFPAFGLRMTDPQEAERVQCPVAAPGSPESSVISWGCAMAHAEVGREAWGTFKAGLLAAAETATFQRRPALEPENNWGRAVAMTEVVVIPGQLALLFLALRRRFRR